MNKIKTYRILVLFTILFLSNLSYSQTFTKIDSGAIFTDGGYTQGSSWGDFDNDNDLDLIIVNGSGNNSFNKNFLYRNEGDGNFTKIETGSIVTTVDTYGGSCWGDYDSDGDLDLFVAVSGGANVLYRNDGGENFTQVDGGDIKKDTGFSVGSCWIDYDNDGDLDIYVINDHGSKNHLYLNEGNDLFKRVYNLSIVKDKAYHLAGSWSDFDNDNDLDLFVANGAYSNNNFYINNGDGTFNGVTTGTLVNDGLFSASVAWGDYDNDGDMDLYVANIHDENLFYNNQGDGTFIQITDGAIVQYAATTCGTLWGDFDNDGDLDLFIPRNDGKSAYFRNEGPEFNYDFTNITSSTNTNVQCGSPSSADYDNDGDLDLLITNGYFEMPFDNYILSNDGSGNSWINIKCTGTVSNKSAIGTRIKAKAIINGTEVWQMRELIQQNSYGGHNGMRIHFGFGDAAIIDSLIIRWPLGHSQIMTDVAVNQFLEITELFPYQHDLMITSSNYVLIESIPLFVNSTPEVTVRNTGTVDESNVSVTCQIDTSGIVIYTDTQSIENLESLSLKTLKFNEWVTPAETKNYNACFYVQFAGDENVSNDTLNSSIKISNLIDDFEVTLDNWEGDTSWTIAKIGHSSESSLTPSDGNYYNNMDSKLTCDVGFDLSQSQAAHLSFWTKHYIEMNHDFGYVEVSPDGGQSWEQLGEPYTGFQINWRNDQLSLNNYCGDGFTNVKIRFRFVSDSTQIVGFMGWLLDDISIYPTDITVVAGGKQKQTPQQYVLFNNYPNPFNSFTKIQYQLPEQTHVKIVIYNMLGQKVKTLINQNHQPGNFKLSWDGTDYLNTPVPSGMYFYRMEAGGFSQVRKMLLLE